MSGLNLMDIFLIFCCADGYYYCSCHQRGSVSDWLLLAVRRGDLTNTKRLVNSLTGDVNYRDPRDGESPLYVAAQYGHLHIGKFLLKNGAAVDMPDYNHETALFKATRRGSVEFVQLLLQKGANVNALNQWGESCLMIACEYGYMTVVQCLLENHANRNIRNQKGETPLDLARLCNHTLIVNLLVGQEES